MKFSVVLPCSAASFFIGMSVAVSLPTKGYVSSPAVVGFPIQKNFLIPKDGIKRRESARKLPRAVVNDGIENRVSLLAFGNQKMEPQAVLIESL